MGGAAAGAEYLGVARDLCSRIARCSRDELLYRPDIADAWTIEEHVQHLADVEINVFLRSNMQALDSAGISAILSQGSMRTRAEVSRVDAATCMNVICAAREAVYSIVDGADEGPLVSIIRSSGERLEFTLRGALAALSQHMDFHIRYIDRNCEEYKRMSGAS